MQIIHAQTPNNISGDEPATLKDLETIVGNIFMFALPLLAIVLFVMLIVGGFKFITSGGDPQKTESAKNTLTWAIAGLVLAAAAFLIIRLIATFTGQEGILNFTIYQN